MFAIIFSKGADKALKGIPDKWRKRIIRAIQILKNNPYEGEKLQGKHSGRYSLKVWPYRIIYIVKKREITVIILDIGHRKRIYR